MNGQIKREHNRSINALQVIMIYTYTYIHLCYYVQCTQKNTFCANNHDNDSGPGLVFCVLKVFQQWSVFTVHPFIKMPRGQTSSHLKVYRWTPYIFSTSRVSVPRRHWCKMKVPLVVVMVEVWWWCSKWFEYFIVLPTHSTIKTLLSKSVSSQASKDIKIHSLCGLALAKFLVPENVFISLLSIT